MWIVDSKLINLKCMKRKGEAEREKERERERNRRGRKVIIGEMGGKKATFFYFCGFFEKCWERK